MNRYLLKYTFNKVEFEINVWAYTLFEAKLKAPKGARSVCAEFIC